MTLFSKTTFRLKSEAIQALMSVGIWRDEARELVFKNSEKQWTFDTNTVLAVL